MARIKGAAAIEVKAQRLGALEIKYVAHGDVKPNAYNPNRQTAHDFDMLKASMRDDGFTSPIIVQRQTGEIVDGEHRWRASHTVNEEEVAAGRHALFPQIPVVYVDMTPEQMRVSTIRHNRARGTHDMELEAQVLRDLQELGAIDWAQNALGLDDTELNRILEDVKAPEAMANDAFGEAWVPSTGSSAIAGGDGPYARVVSASDAAVHAQHVQEQRIREAKTEEDRVAATRDVNVFRFTLVFANEEADVVRIILGDKPADRILELCRAEVARTT